MRKRIGTKIYDTETSEYVSDVGVGDLYRKQTREREWFLVIGKSIEPLDEKQARALLGETAYKEKPVDERRIMVAVDRKTHATISWLAKKDNFSITEEVRKIVSEYLELSKKS